MNFEMRYVKFRDLSPICQALWSHLANEKRIVEVIDNSITYLYPVNGVNDIYSSKYCNAYRDFVNAREEKLSIVIFFSVVLLESIGGFAAGFILFIKNHSLSHGCMALSFLIACFVFLWALTKETMRK